MKPAPLVILIPVYRDYESLGLLLPSLAANLRNAGYEATVVVLDDGTPGGPGVVEVPSGGGISDVRIVPLLRNLGHQRAIAIGLSWLNDHIHPSATVVMDSDGEDRPEDVPRLLERLKSSAPGELVFAERTRRTEGTAFRFGYFGFRILHRLLTGIPVRIGNFSAIPGEALPRLVVISELWNHYAAAVVRVRLPHLLVPTSRGPRLAGRPQMNFVALVTHGLSALAVFAEVIGVRLLVAVAGLTAIFAATAVGLAGWPLTGAGPVPPAAFAVTGVLLVLLMATGLLAAGFVFIVLAGRQAAPFIPRRDYATFVAELRSDK